MKTAFVASAVVRCRQYVENQVVVHVDAAIAWEWRMLKSLAVLGRLETFFRNALAAGPGALFADRANDEDGAALPDGRHDTGHLLPVHFGFFEEGLGPGESHLGP